MISLSFFLSMCVAPFRLIGQHRATWRLNAHKLCNFKTTANCCCLYAWIDMYTLVQWFMCVFIRCEFHQENRGSPNCLLHFSYCSVFCVHLLDVEKKYHKIFERQQVICELVSSLVIIIHLFMTMRSSQIITNTHNKLTEKFEQPQNWLSKRIRSEKAK